MKHALLSALLIAIACLFLTGCDSASRVVVGSKHFNEGYILAEIIAQVLEDGGFSVQRRFGLGGTMVCFQALINGEIDVYPEYTGTLEQAILKVSDHPRVEELRTILRREHDLELLDSFGFNNTYALAVRRSLAMRLDLKTIADLRAHPDLRFGLSHEFQNRNDGWPGLAKIYGFALRPLGIEHGLIYQAIAEGKVDVIDVYSTDAEIQRYDLVVLEDNLGYFPTYLAAPLLRADLDPRVAELLAGLAGTIDETEMQRLNAAVVVDKKSFAEVAHDFLRRRGLLHRDRALAPGSRWSLLAYRTATHVKLTAIAVLAGMAIAIPFGMLIYRIPALSRPVLYTAGLLQTIPSIALLAFMIPLFGIGPRPAIVALFLYALLPILRNTYAALQSIDPVLKKVAVGMGLTVWQRLRHVELPLAMPTILAGVRTATVINIGTATLAAFIGAGGLGEPIVTGLALNDTALILEGAVPAAILAIVAELVFEGTERLLIPKHLLRQSLK